MGSRSRPPIAWALAATAVSFAALGLALPVVIDTALFALYRAALEAGVGDGVDPRTRTLLLGITGGSIAGKWVAHLALVGPLARGEGWAKTASLWGLGAWLVIDSAVSLGHGAWWNVVFVNLVPVLSFGVLLLSCRTVPDATAPPPIELGSPTWWVLGACAVGAASGLLIALGGTSLLFDPWRAALCDAHYDSVPSAAAARLAASFFGPIGGSTFAQFLLLGALARHAVARGDRRALDWTLASFLAWLVPDSAWSIASDGLFNVLLVNLPFAALSLPVLLWARMRLARPLGVSGGAV